MQLPIRVAREGGSPDGAVDPPPERCSDRHEEGAAARLQKPSEFPNRRKGRSGERLSLGGRNQPSPEQIWSAAMCRRFFSEATCRLAPKREHVRALHTVRGKARAKNYSLGQRTSKVTFMEHRGRRPIWLRQRHCSRANHRRSRPRGNWSCRPLDQAAILPAQRRMR